MTIQINVDEMVQFLTTLLNTPSPTGDAQRGIAAVQAAFEALSLPTRITPKGTLVITWDGEADDAPRALTAHVDTLGGMVQKVNGNGRLRLTQLGGWMWGSVEGIGVTIFASNGEEYRGTILPVYASAHAAPPAERKKVHTAERMEVRIDARTNSKAETAALGIRVGDFVAFDPRVETGEHGFIRSRHLDDKASIACIYGAVRGMMAAGIKPAQRTTIHISNYEEVGHGAAAGFPDDIVDLLTVDMAVVAAGQESTEYGVTICAKDSAGPYHLGFRRELEALAEAEGLDYNTDVYLYYGSDGEAFWRAGGDVRVALIGPGVDASHHYERTHRDSLEATAVLIAAYLQS